MALAVTIAVSQHDFQPLPMFSGWEPYGDGLAEPAYWVDDFDICRLRGVAYNPGPSFLTSYVAFPLPAPADPNEEPFIVGAAGGFAVVSIITDPSGNGALRYDLGSLDPGAFAYLSTISYPT
jgi:hypothetical protein